MDLPRDGDIDPHPDRRRLCAADDPQRGRRDPQNVRAGGTPLLTFPCRERVSRVERRSGRSIALSPSFGAVMRLALDAARSTGGSFDPTVLYAMEAIGYDRDFDEVLAGARGVLRPAVPCGRWRDVTLEDDVLRVPAGVGIDLGGIAKGWTADLAATRALEAGLPGPRRTPGGDLRIVGAPAIDVAVEDPETAPSSAGSRSVKAGSRPRRSDRDPGVRASIT